MLKRVLICIAFALSNISLNAQTVKYEESAPFAEVDGGWLKLLSMKNGKTALLHLTNKDGIDIKIYDAVHKLVIDQTVKPKYSGGELRANFNTIVGVLNVDEDIVVLIKTKKESGPALLRLIIDGNTGVLKAEEDLIQIPKKDKIGWVLPKPELDLSSFDVRKDLYSDNYAVCIFYFNASDIRQKLEFIHYGTNNRQISRSFYSLNDDIKDIRLIDFVVLGPNKIVASAYANTSDDENDGYLTIGALDSGSKTIKTKRVDLIGNSNFTQGLLRYNRKENLVAIAGVHKIEEKKSITYYNATMTFVDPATLSMIFTKEIEMPNVNDEYNRIFNKKEGYKGLPQDLYINEDGSYSIVFEELSSLTVLRSNGMKVTNTKLGSIAVAHLDDKTKTISDFLIPKAHELSIVDQEIDYEPFYISKRQGAVQSLQQGAQYKSFTYANGVNSNYILFNDIVENTENIKKGKLNAVNGVSGADAYIYTVSGNTLKKEFLFGAPPAKVHYLIMASVSEYVPSTRTYISLKLENDHGKKLKVIWLNL